MSGNTPTDIVNAFMAAMEKMDFNSALQFVADDLVYINSPNAVAHGPVGVRQTLEPFFAPIEENEFRILRIVSEANQVVTERLDRHRVAQGWFELPVTGVFEVHDGKISYWREYFDAQTIQQAMQQLLGANP
jgi:limonene-1,2-epoxide hydrolase